MSKASLEGAQDHMHCTSTRGMVSFFPSLSSPRIFQCQISIFSIASVVMPANLAASFGMPAGERFRLGVMTISVAEKNLVNLPTPSRIVVVAR